MKEERFSELVYGLTKQIPEGTVSTYGCIASALGRPKAAREVGRILALNPSPLEVPCHRVVHSDGRLGGYSGGPKRKVELLAGEGVRVKGGRVDRFGRVLFKDFKV